MTKTTRGSLLLMTLYTFHFADEDVSVAISSFLNSDSHIAKVKPKVFSMLNQFSDSPTAKVKQFY